MKINEITLIEQPVLSSWIEDLTYTKNAVIMTLGNAYEYKISNVPQSLYRAWIQAPSKGRFWHRRIKDRFVVTRL
jgi:hypothetical protein